MERGLKVRTHEIPEEIYEGLDGVSAQALYDIVMSTPFRTRYARFVMAVYKLTNDCETRVDLTISQWSALLSRIEKAAELRTCPAESYWALSAMMDICALQPDLFTSPFVHGMLASEMSKFRVVRTDTDDIEHLSASVVTTMQAFITYLNVWYHAPKFFKGVQRDFFMTDITRDAVSSVFDRVISESFVAFFEVILMDMSFNVKCDNVFRDQILYLLRVILHEVQDANSSLRGALLKSPVHWAMYYVACDPAARSGASYDQHKGVMRDIVKSINGCFALVSTTPQGTYVPVKTYRTVVSALMSVKQSPVLLQQLVPGESASEPVRTLEDLERELEEEDLKRQQSDEARRRRNQRKKLRKKRKKTTTSATADDADADADDADADDEDFVLPPVTMIPDEVHAYLKALLCRPKSLDVCVF